MDFSEELKSLSDKTMALLGVSNVAYIRRLPVDEGESYAICAADGTQLAVFTSFDAAYYTARQHDLEPLSVH